ncbi:Doublecortin domain-containing protein 2C, partial [Intoshia linei]
MMAETVEKVETEQEKNVELTQNDKYPLPVELTLSLRLSEGGAAWDNFEHLSDLDSAFELLQVFEYIKKPTEIRSNGGYVDVNLFKKGIRPAWEDEKNKNGFRMVCIFESSQTAIDDAWESYVYQFAGATLGEFNDYVNGLTLSVRKNLFKIWMWLSTTLNDEQLDRMTDKMKTISDQVHGTQKYLYSYETSKHLKMSYVPIASKRVRFYLNGSKYFSGRDVVINRSKFRTFETFMIELTSMLNCDRAVRSIRTPSHGTRIKSFEKLMDRESYVAIQGKIPFRKINYKNITIINPVQQATQREKPIKPVIHSRIQMSGRIKHIPIDGLTLNIYENGNEYDAAKHLVLPNSIRNSLKNINAYISQKIKSHSGGVKYLYTAKGRRIRHIRQLENGNFYVAVGNTMSRFIKVPYGNVRPSFITTLNKSAFIKKFEKAPVPTYSRLGNHSKLLVRRKEYNIQSYYHQDSNENEKPNYTKPAQEKTYSQIAVEKEVLLVKAAKSKFDKRKIKKNKPEKKKPITLKTAEQVPESEDVNIDLPVEQMEAEQVNEEINDFSEPKKTFLTQGNDKEFKDIIIKRKSESKSINGSVDNESQNSGKTEKIDKENENKNKKRKSIKSDKPIRDNLKKRESNSRETVISKKSSIVTKDTQKKNTPTIKSSISKDRESKKESISEKESINGKDVNPKRDSISSKRESVASKRNSIKRDSVKRESIKRDSIKKESIHENESLKDILRPSSQDDVMSKKNSLEFEKLSQKSNLIQQEPESTFEKLEQEKLSESNQDFADEDSEISVKNQNALNDKNSYPIDNELESIEHESEQQEQKKSLIEYSLNEQQVCT